MGSICTKIYYYPVTGSGKLNRATYKLFLRFNDTCLVRMIKNCVRRSNKNKARTTKAYQEIYKKNGEDTVITKQNFHIDYPDYHDRIPTNTSEDYLLKKITIVTTSGSTSGKPSEIPMHEHDAIYLRNYYHNLGIISNGTVPHEYGYINMFPISNSSTGVLSETIVPEDKRLGRANGDPAKACEILEKNINSSVPIILGGLPILHLSFIDYLKQTGKQNIADYVKENCVCLFGGESPTIDERLKLFVYYKDLISIYGSTEMGPRLGFSLNPNFIIDIAMLLDEVSGDLGIKTSHIKPVSFFYDKYVHDYEIIGEKLINTPFIQQFEVKIKWDQDDYCLLIDPKKVLEVLKRHAIIIEKKLREKVTDINTNLGVVNENADKLVSIFNEMLHGRTFNQLFKYFGMLFLFGRNGLIYGGANLDSKFVEIVSEEIKKTENGNKVNHMAICRIDREEKQNDVNTTNYSGLQLDILVELTEELKQSELIELKNNIIHEMKKQHHDFECIVDGYTQMGQYDNLYNNIRLWVYNYDESPMHHRSLQTGKKIYVMKKVNDDMFNKYYTMA